MQKERLQKDFNILKSFPLIFLAITSLFYLGGCIGMLIPTPEHGYPDMIEISKDMVKQLETGITTKDDVRLILGEPAEKDDRFYTYWWKRKDGYFFAMANTGVFSSGSTIDLHAFCLEFMPDGRLKRFKHFESRWFKREVYKQVRGWKKKAY